MRLRQLLPLALAACLASAAAAAGEPHAPSRLVALWTIRYHGADGRVHRVAVRLPARYGPARRARLALVLSPGAGRKLWGDLPARGDFAVATPLGAADADELAELPKAVRSALPW